VVWSQRILFIVDEPSWLGFVSASERVVDGINLRSGCFASTSVRAGIHFVCFAILHPAAGTPRRSWRLKPMKQKWPCP